MPSDAPPAPWFRWLAYAMAALLAVSVALQYNDPDPARWMVIYGVGSVLSVLLPARRAVAVPGVVLGAAALGWAAYLVYDTWGVIGLGDLTGRMSEKGGAVEEGREAGGLAIEGVWLVAAGLYRRRRGG